MLLPYRLILLVSILLFGSILPLEAQNAGAETKRQRGTQLIISLFDNLVAKNILGINHLKSLLEHTTLINPIEESEAYASHEIFVYKKQLSTMLAHSKDVSCDLQQIHQWARAKLLELDQKTFVREEVHEQTKDIYRPMAFVPIPAGHYQSLIDGNIIVIADDVEIQDAPVTQHQWMQVMGNASEYIPDNPDAPITSKSVDLIEINRFITKLNNNNPDYTYALPSVDEYDALLQAILGKNWLEQVKNLDACSDKNQTCSVASGNFIEHNNKRVWDVIGTLWQWTRDTIDLNKSSETAPGAPIDDKKGVWGFLDNVLRWIKDKIDPLPKTAHLVFGTSFATKKDTLTNIAGFLRPIILVDSKNSHVGFRLIRFKKARMFHQELKNYKRPEISWDEKYASYDSDWKWDDVSRSLIFVGDMLSHMIHHKSQYSPEIQHTLYVVLKNMGCNDAACLKQKEHLVLMNKKISNASPLAYMPHLTGVNLEDNQIRDISALGQLTNLEWLNLSNNQISNISSLEQLIHLKELYLLNNQITDVSPLAHLTNLKELYLTYNQIKDASPLANLKHTHIALYGNPCNGPSSEEIMV
jgi:Leucine-rich repeat (LRR) protein